VSEIRVEDFFGFWKCNVQTSRLLSRHCSLADGKLDALNKSVGSSIGHHWK